MRVLCGTNLGYDGQARRAAGLAAAPTMSAPRTRPTAQNPSDTSSHERDEQSLRELERQKASASRRDRDREPHGSRRDRDRSTKQRASSQRPSTLKNWQRVLLAVLFFCGPIGTLVSFWLLPKEADSAVS